MSDKNDGFKVDAQGYGIGNYVSQYLTPGGARRAVTESVSPKFQERMETLRDADKGMRNVASNLKDYLSSAQTAFKDNRYLDVAHWCSQIDAAVRGMVLEGKPVVDLQDAEIAEFYTRYEDAEPDHEYFSADDGLIATAGILDRLFGNSIEKLYWKKVKESKLAVQSLIKKAEKLITIVLSCLGRMGDARAKGNISAWIEDLQRIGKAQSEFQIFARGIYDKHLKQLAEIVRANRPKPSVTPAQAPVNKSVPAMPEANKAPEAAELINEAPIVPEAVQKTEPGRPTRDQAAKKKEMEQIDQLQKALNNPVKQNVEIPAETPATIPEAIENKKDEPVITQEVPNAEIPKVETPKIEAPKAVPSAPLVAKIPEPIKAPKIVEQPKAAPVKPEIIKEVPTQMTSSIPETLTAPITEIAPSVPSAAVSTRPRGRPRMYPVGESPTDIKKRERENRKNQLQNLVNAPAEVPVDDSVIPTPPVEKSVKPSSESKPVSKPIPSSELIKNPEEKLDLHKKVIDAPPEEDKKIVFVLLPKIKPDNLDAMQYRLMKDLGHPVKFVTQENGKQLAMDYIQAGWDVQGMTFDEVKSIDNKHKNDPLEMLNDPEFIASLPRLSNGMFDKGKLINDDGQMIQGNKVVSVPSKYPDFQNLDEKTRKAVIDKLNKLEEDPTNLIIPVKKEKKTKENETIKSDDSPEIKPESPETKSEPKIEPTLEDEIKEEDNIAPLSEEEEEMAIYAHGDILTKLLKKKIEQIDKNDIFHLLENPAYIKSLPRDKDNNFNIDLISKFPEFKIMQKAGMSKKYISVLHNKEAIEKRTKAAGMHELFFSELQKVANVEDYGLMAAMMCAYSEEIESFDPEISTKLIIAAGKLID